MSRSGRQTVGMILASVVMGGRSRYLMLRAYGDIWAVSTNDVQFVLPPSLIDPQLVEACWSPEIVELWAKGEQESSFEGLSSMLEARRTVAVTLRRVVRETERMSTRMMAATVPKGGLEGLWKQFASKDPNVRSSMSSVEAATFLLDQEGDIKPHTLPAFAAHSILMQYPHLFVADTGAMAENGRFLLRSRAERARLDKVMALIHSTDPDEKAVIERFIGKASKAIEFSKTLQTNTLDWKEVPHDLPTWSESEQDLIWAMLMSLYETRSTQDQIMPPILTTLLKNVKAYADHTLDRETVAQFAEEIGVLPPWETLRRSEIAEDQMRRSSLLPVVRETDPVLLKGNELDSIREDFTGHTVFVVDDIGAQELDDGVSIERIPGSDDVWIHAHVADPTRLLGPNHPIAARAAARGTAAYFPEGNVSLFGDESLSGASLGATEGDTKAVMTFSSKVSPTGEVSDSTVRLGFIKKPRIITYDAVDQSLDLAAATAYTWPFGKPDIAQTESAISANPTATDIDDLRLLHTVSLGYRRRRMLNAGLDSFLPENRFRVLSRPPHDSPHYFDRAQIPSKSTFWAGSPLVDYSVGSLEHNKTFAARQVIAEVMIMANRAAAAFCSSRIIPVPFRVCPAPVIAPTPSQAEMTLDDIMAMRDPETLTLDFFKLAQTSIKFNAGKVSLTPREHWFMGFNDNVGYLRATSPLRRYDDLLAHWQIKAALAAEKGLQAVAPQLPEDWVRENTMIAESATVDTRNASRFSHSWWQADLLQRRRGNPRPNGYSYDQHSIDINGSLDAVIAGVGIFAESGSKINTPIYVPAIGTLARLLKSEHETIGERIKVRLDSVQKWPNPFITMVDA